MRELKESFNDSKSGSDDDRKAAAVGNLVNGSIELPSWSDSHEAKSTEEEKDKQA